MGQDEIRDIMREELERARKLAEDAARKPVGVNRAARILGVGKDTLRRLIDAKLVRTIPWVGKQQPFRIPADEIERIQRQGLPKLAPLPPKPRGRKKAAGDAAGREAAVARILKHPVE